MKRDLKNIIECYSCGLFVKKQPYENLSQRCPRCNTKIITSKKHSLDSLYYAFSSLLIFILLSLYPLISISINDIQIKATLFGTISILLEQNLFFVALVVLFTIIIAPVLNSLVIIFSFIQIHTKFKIFTDTLLHDGFYFFKKWAFIEVFIISIIVSYIKLIAMFDTTEFNLGFYLMLAYIFSLFMMNVRFEGKTVLGE
ncbi:MAG: paraquat-inducible protein A [Poseidonibacter sp.]|uniref:paraquat-inducible protein A n=1 Tax=Poseidonibacter sp. TaxID=2321188 RepID=UPI00359D0C26